MSTYPINLESGVLLIEAKIIGQRMDTSVRMILDTGATYTMIDPDVLVDVGYPLSQVKDKRAITTASGIEYCPFLKIKALSTLGHALKGVEICAHSLPPGIPARGLLGLNFLRYFNIHLNFLDGHLEFWDRLKRFDNLQDFLKDLKK